MTDTTATSALPEIRLTFGGLSGWPLEDLAVGLMTHIDRHVDVVDPIVSAYPHAGELSVSFELRGASGDPADDVRRAMALFAQALSELSQDEAATLSEVDMRADALTHPRHVEYAKAS